MSQSYLTSPTETSSPTEAVESPQTVREVAPERNLRAGLSVGPLYDTHGDGGALLQLRIGHRFRVADSLGFVVGLGVTPLVVISNNDAHNRTAMALDAGAACEWQAGLRWTLGISGGTAIGASQSVKLGSGPYLSATLDAYVPLNDVSGVIFGLGAAWLRSEWSGSESATLLHLRLGLGWVL